MQILREPAGVFSPEKICVINRAYESALGVLEQRPLLKRGLEEQTARVEIARALMRLAEQGESDEGLLREKALFHLAVLPDPAS